MDAWAAVTQAALHVHERILIGVPVFGSVAGSVEMAFAHRAQLEAKRPPSLGSDSALQSQDAAGGQESPRGLSGPSP